MAYDPVKAHEYYTNYRKKGLKKGRKKGKGKTSNAKKGRQTTLLGTSAAGLNDEGRIQAALIREKLKKQMNEALKKAKTDEEKEKIRIEYSRKAQQELTALKNDPKYAKPKAQKAPKSTSSSAKSSSSEKGQKSAKNEQKEPKQVAVAVGTSAYAGPTSNDIEDIQARLALRADEIIKLAKNLPPAQRKLIAKRVQSIIDRLKKLKGANYGRSGKGVDGQALGTDGASYKTDIFTGSK
jgi:hypothetical protein